MQLRIRFFFVLFLFTCLQAYAQQPLFINYGVKEGLPSSEVYDILEDHDGYMWFATDAGVSRYDGYHFHNYTSEDGLPDNTVFGITEDKYHRIWFRTFSGQLAWWKNDTIHTIGANSKILAVQKKNTTYNISFDKGDTLWCGVAGIGGYFYKIAPPYDANNMQVISYTNSMHGTYVHWLADSSYVVSCYGSPKDSSFGLSFFNHNLFSRQVTENQPLMRRNVPRFCRLPGNRFFWGGNNGQGFIIDGRSQKEMVLPLHDIFFAGTVHGDTWLGYSIFGVWLYPDGQLEKPGIHYLDGLSVTCVAVDREGGKWFSTLENGVYYLPPGNFFIYNKSTGFADNKVGSVYAEGDSAIWAGCRNGYCCRIKKSVTNTYALSDKQSRVILIEEAIPGWLFISSSNSKLYQVSTGKIILTSSAFAYAFTKGPDGTGWIAGKDYLSNFDLSTGGILARYNLPVLASCLCFDRKGVLWLGSITGLWSFSNGKFTDHSNEDPLLKNRIESICFGADGTMWMATRGGGVLYRGTDQKIHQLTSHDGLASNICRSIFIDKEKLVWVATNHGISCINWNNDKISIHNMGIAGDLLGEVNSLTRVGDTIWAATSQGLVAFDKHFVFSSPADPPVHLVSALVNGKPFSGSRLNYEENSLLFSFVGLSYKAHGNLRYKYRLEGLETEWHITTATEIQYAKLPPGNYRFVVAVIRTDGTTGSQTASFAFSIATPFWKTAWFIVLCSISFCLLTLFIFRNRLKLERDRARTANRITLLELTALRAQMNPHFIFNAMNSIQHFILKNDKFSAQKYLSQFSKLIRSVLENSKQSTITLGQEIEALELYTGLEKVRASRPFTSIIEADKNLQTDMIRIPPLIIQPYVENAILHGLMPLQERDGNLSVTFYMAGDYLECVIEDNGIGRKKAKALRSRDGHHPVGLSLTGRRIEILNQNKEELVGLTIEDKISTEGEPMGTRVVLLIPVK
jgi:ligand-binding sensor domain-containing protein